MRIASPIRSCMIGMKHRKHGVTLEEFGKTLADLKPGQSADVPYHVYEELFPPGEPDQGARKRAYDFAKAAGVAIDNQVAAGVVRFHRKD